MILSAHYIGTACGEECGHKHRSPGPAARCALKLARDHARYPAHAWDKPWVWKCWWLRGPRGGLTFQRTRVGRADRMKAR